LVRERIVIASIPNILSYARDLGLHKRKVKKKKQKRGSIEAEDEVWHMDITQINSKEGIVHYLHLLIDNYSRKILSWRMDTRIRAKNSRHVTKQAIRQMADRKKSAMLITDGGSEFDNVLMRTAMAGTGLELKIAGKDVEFSNSIIEAVNKSLKYRHIFPRELPKASRLKEYILRGCSSRSTNTLEKPTCLSLPHLFQILSKRSIISGTVPIQHKCTQRAQRELGNRSVTLGELQPGNEMSHNLVR
jgi:transposase InsO family protein